VNDWPYGNSFQKSFTPQACDLVPNINGILGVSVTNLLVELKVLSLLLDTGIFGQRKTGEKKDE
jgi:hypothetical protein